MATGKRGVPVVFISSTEADLKAHREAARDAVLRSGWRVEMMEYFPARGAQPSLTDCLAKVDDADIVVALVAHRYGWIPPDQPGGLDKSITWLECEHARAAGKEVLAFIVDDQHPWPPEHRDEDEIARAVREGRATPEILATVQRNVNRLGEFKQWLGSRFRSSFTTPEDLRGNVLHALNDWGKRRAPAAGQAGAPLPRPKKQREADPTAYLRSLASATASIDIRGLQVGSVKAHSFPIEALYMSLTTMGVTGRREAQRRLGAKEGKAAQFERPAPVPLQAALAERRLVVVGDPGAGKSTFARRMANALSRAWLDEGEAGGPAALGIEGRPFPILVRLGELAEHIADTRRGASASRPTTREAAAWLPHFLAARSQDEGWGLDGEFFRRRIVQGPCLLLLDGLDEAPDRVSRESLARLIGHVGASSAGSRMVVTTRPGAHVGEAVLPGFAQVQIDPLTPGAVDTFLSQWSRALHAQDPAAAERHRAELAVALAIPEIARMARNPVMLTALAVVHWNEHRLPEQRAELYESVIRWLSRSREQRPGRLGAERCVALVQELALAMQRTPEGRKVQVPRRWAAEAIASEVEGKTARARIGAAERFLEDEELDSGIVVGRGRELRFWHLTFQEYLAARAIAARGEAEQRGILWDGTGRLFAPEWREVALLFAGILHQHGRPKVDGLVSAALDGLGKRPALADQARAAGLLGAMVRDLATLDYAPRDPRYATLLESVQAVFDPERSRTIPLADRIAAADALGHAGDPRLDPTSQERWVTIPGGTFLMGAQKTARARPNYSSEAEDDEAPVHEVRLDAYRIGRYPVTVLEYRRFVAADGYQEERWWAAGAFGQWTAPEAWEDQIAFPSRPVVGVSWFDAAAYCCWARCRLPTEAEWERAARGSDGRPYPWGKPAPDPERLDYAGKVGHLTPVGVYPLGATPDGISDLAGNALEWCQDWYAEDYYKHSPSLNPQGPPDGSGRVVRGGSWIVGAWGARSACRSGVHPGSRFDFLGFRVVVGGARTRAYP